MSNISTKNSNGQKSDLSAYNSFCDTLNEGDILYNIDNTNLWGEYLLVSVKSVMKVGNIRTYFILLLGLEEEGDSLIASNTRVNLTPDKAGNVPFLKYIGHCKYMFFPLIKEEDINKGLVDVYKNTELWKYNRKAGVRKPRTKKYDKYGDLSIKPTSNEGN